MAKTRIYLDNCTYNRPFDDKDQLTIRLEAEAKLKIQEDIRGGAYELAWSYMNEYENNDNPYEDKREAIGIWEHIAAHKCLPDEKVLKAGKHIHGIGIKPKDSLNLACAIECNCHYYITTDKSLLKKAGMFSKIKVINPIDFIREKEESDGNDN
jgi:predicted nucleic acid-binding protein